MQETELKTHKMKNSNAVISVVANGNNVQLLSFSFPTVVVYNDAEETHGRCCKESRYFVNHCMYMLIGMYM